MSSNLYAEFPRAKLISNKRIIGGERDTDLTRQGQSSLEGTFFINDTRAQ